MGQFWLEVLVPLHPWITVGAWTFSINRNPHPQESAGIPKSLTLPLMDIWLMTGILRPFSENYWVENCLTVPSPTSIFAVKWTARVTSSEPRHQNLWIWGFRLSTRQMKSQKADTWNLLVCAISCFGEVTAVGTRRMRSEQNYSYKTDFVIWRKIRTLGAKIFQWVNYFWTQLLLVRTIPTEQHHQLTWFLPEQKLHNPRHEHDQQSHQHYLQCRQHDRRILQSNKRKRTYQCTQSKTHLRQTHHQSNLIRHMTEIAANL